MIRIEVVRQGGQVRSVRVSGHAAAGPHGQDIVCAGVSAHLQIMDLGLREVAGLPGADLKSGRFVWERGEQAVDAGGEAILETLVKGLESFAETDPRHVRIRIRKE